MLRVWGLKIFTLFMCFSLLAGVHFIRVPSATAQTYKLGKTYAGCLEGYSGESASSTQTCACENDSDCVQRGDGLACVSGICRQCKTDAHCEQITNAYRRNVKKQLIAQPSTDICIHAIPQTKPVMFLATNIF